MSPGQLLFTTTVSDRPAFLMKKPPNNNREVFFLTKWFCYSANIAVERYLSPVSGNKTTMVLPAFNFDIDKCRNNIHLRNKDIEVYPISALKDQGVDELYNALLKFIKK